MNLTSLTKACWAEGREFEAGGFFLSMGMVGVEVGVWGRWVELKGVPVLVGRGLVMT